MKLRHGPAAIAFNPLFMLGQMPGLIAWSFRGSTLKTFLGLEDQRKAFDRYRALRAAERLYLWSSSEP